MKLWHKLCVLGCLLLPVKATAEAAFCPKHEHYFPVERQRLDSIFYRITDCTGRASYILGTLHSSDPAILNSIKYTFPYIKQSTHAWFELEKKPDDQAKSAALMFIPHEQDGLKDMIGTASFKKMVGLFHKHGMKVPESFLDRYKPWAAAVALQLVTIDISSLVMDDVVAKEAKKYGVQVQALEQLEEQLSVFERFSQAEQIDLLKDSINKFNSHNGLSKEMVRYYKKGDLQKLETLSTRTFHMLDNNEVRRKMKQWMIDDRNEGMAHRVIPSLERGGAFIAVGALHLPGDTGLLQAFERAGFGIHPVRP